MITCGSCGNQNDLGRVFCVQCGGKLDLSAMTSQTLAEQAEVGFFKKHWPKFAIGVVVIIVLIYGLTFWPSRELIAEKGTSVGGRRIESCLRSMAGLPKGRTLAYELKEADINGYFQLGAGKDMGLGNVTVKCLPSVLQVHVATSMFKTTIGGIVLEPGTTYDLYCIGVGGNLIVRKVKKGHLSMIGPGKNAVVMKLYKGIAAKNGFDAFKYATDIKIEEGKVRVTVSNR